MCPVSLWFIVVAVKGLHAKALMSCAETSADLNQYRLELISPEETLTGRKAETVVLYSLSKSVPIVKPLCEWHVGNAGYAWTASSCDAKGIECQLASEETSCLGLRVCKQ